MKDPRTKIPFIREQMLELALELKDKGLRSQSRRLVDMASRTYRDPSIFKKTAPKMPTMTLKEARPIYRFKQKNLNWSNHEVSVKFGCNIGRVRDAYAMMAALERK